MVKVSPKYVAIKRRIFNYLCFHILALYLVYTLDVYMMAL